MEFPKFKRDVSLSESVYQAIYEQIINGHLKPSQKITEAWLAQSMGISRAPVREAFKRLFEDRLVVLVPRSGCYIAKLSLEEIEEIYEIRKRLESMALEYAINKIDKKEIVSLYKRFIRCQKNWSINLAHREIELDSEFHTLVAKSSGCTNLQEMLGKLRVRVQMFRVMQADYQGRALIALQEHIDIIKAILEGDKTRAIESLVSHIEHTKQNVLNVSRKMDNTIFERK